MSQYMDSSYHSFTAGVAIAQYLRVKISSGKLAVAVAGVTDEPVEIGYITEAAFADLDVRTVRLRNGGGTGKLIASAAITAGAAIYGAASGKVSATASGSAIGIAIEAAAADGDVIEVLYY